MLSRLKSDRTLLLFIFFLKVILLLKLIASRITSKVYATEQKNPKNQTKCELYKHTLRACALLEVEVSPSRFMSLCQHTWMQRKQMFDVRHTHTTTCTHMHRVRKSPATKISISRAELFLNVTMKLSILSKTPQQR